MLPELTSDGRATADRHSHSHGLMVAAVTALTLLTRNNVTAVTDAPCHQTHHCYLATS
jgi:hypothetical protein